MSDPLLTLQVLAKTLRGPLSFLRADASDLYDIVPDLARSLPRPQQIFMAEESSSPLVGFPILVSEGMTALREALIEALKVEERTQVMMLRRESHDPSHYREVWDQYLGLLERITENVTTSSYGRNFPNIFWLQHSLDVARVLKETPRRVMRLDSTIGREHGGAIKYGVLYKYLDRVLKLTYDLVSRLAADTEEAEGELFPALLTKMRDNVLVFTEDYISTDLGELVTYLDANVRIDSRDFRYRLAKISEWHSRLVKQGDSIIGTVKNLLGADPTTDPRVLFKYRGYVSYLASRPDYDPQRYFDPTLTKVWERLLVKLKEFELLHGMRRLVVPLHDKDGDLLFEERSLNRTWTGPMTRRVSAATRPMDFMAPWVVDPSVARYGLIYDVTDFSHIVSVLRRSGETLQDRSFRMMFRFQRRVNRTALAYRLTLEKYLGDGAFFSGREPWRLVAAAIQVQRYYKQALAEGFPFDRGMRIALNFGHYRLLPVQGAQAGEPDRYEFFGHGVVELARLTSGKSMREIEEIKILLVNMGYPSRTVDKFFAPLADKRTDLVDKNEEERRFYAYINRNGKLVNEGIVATEQFIEHLAKGVEVDQLHWTVYAGREFVVLPLPAIDTVIPVGIRKLGIASLKGLDPLPAYEIVDGSSWEIESLRAAPTTDLMPALERGYAQGLAES